MKPFLHLFGDDGLDGIADERQFDDGAFDKERVDARVRDVIVGVGERVVAHYILMLLMTVTFLSRMAATLSLRRRACLLSKAVTALIRADAKGGNVTRMFPYR